MILGKVKRGFNIDNVDLESGIITVTYTCETEEGPLAPLTFTLGLPLNDKIKDKNFILEFVQLSYPEDEFQRQRLVKRYDIPEQIKTDLENNPIELSEDFIRSSKNIEPSEEAIDNGKSVYGDEYSIVAMRHIIIETLEDLGLLK